MAKRTTFGTIKPFKATKSSKPKPPPAMRKTQYENLLCQAIASSVTVMLRYDDDLQFREFGPTAVYYSDEGRTKVLVSGEQFSNPNDYQSKNGPHNFEVDRIVDLKLGSNAFNPDARISVSDNKYRYGIICSV
ncbi:hypothetical protein [Sphingorhabdus contaminans]|uniref:hypothetical protein n=1 Tax=Sphingorhabdus contaminans TaxID=1343899 RepID=UPI003D2A1DB2